MTEPTPLEPHPFLPEDPGPVGSINFVTGGPRAILVIPALGPSGRPLPPQRTTLYAPWECKVCGCIFESLDEPGLACGVSFGNLEVMCRPCFDNEERDHAPG